MLGRLLLLVSVAMTAMPAFAQDNTTPATREIRCLLGGRAFSTGATARAADRVELCDASGKWVDTDKAASGCLLADRFYSVGATSAGNGRAGSVCGPDGTWTTGPATATKP